jgi:hypothetical protein
LKIPFAPYRYNQSLIEPWTRVRTLHHVYLTPRAHVFPPLVHGYISRITTENTEPRHCILDVWSSHTTCGHPPSHYVLAPHSFYSCFPIRTQYISNQHFTVFSPDHLHAHISCYIVRVISPRNFLCVLAELPEDTFSPPTCASFTNPIV